MGYSEIRQAGLWKDLSDTLNNNFNEISADIMALENKTESSKGLYETEENLKKAHPKPLPGYWALIGTTSPFKVYIEENGQWKDSGGTMTPGIPLGEYLKASPINDLTDIL